MPPLRPSPLDCNGMASLRPASQHGPTRAVTSATASPFAPPLRRLADLAAEAAEILAGLATAAENLDDSAGNGDIQLAGGGGSSLMDAVEATDVQPSPGTSIDLLSIADIARILGIGERSVRRWRSEGALPPAIEIGGLLRWRREVVEVWIAEREGLEGSR